MSLIDYIIPSVKDILEKNKKSGYLFNVVSLFAGGGGSSTGYRMAGGKVLAVNEFIAEAQRTYCANYPDTHIFTEDVRKLTSASILNQIGKKPFELDILDGSPPCSAFSTAGSKSKGWGKQKKYSDKKQSNVEDLFFEYIRLLDDIKPKVFVAENVSGLAKGDAKGYLNQIIRGLRECGYVVECKLLNAKHLGIPQTRPRLIFVGVRSDLWRDKYKGQLHPKPFNYIVNLKEAFKDLKFTETDRVETDLTRFKVYHLLKTLKPGQIHKKAFTLSKGTPLKFSQCITASMGGLGGRDPYHWDNRAFTVSEIKRIMSVPDDYILTGTYGKKVERLGRMVPPLMMKAIAENIYNVVLKNGN